MPHDARFVVAPARYGKRALRLMLVRWLKGRAWVMPFYRVLRQRRMWHGGHIDWRKLLHGATLASPASSGPRVLIATSTGGHLTVARVEQTLGVALQQRGANVSFLLCDGALPACMMCEKTTFTNTQKFVERGPQSLLCNTCFAPAAAALEPLAIPLHRYGSWLEVNDESRARGEVAALSIDQLQRYLPDGLHLGEHAYAAACRFFGTSDVFAMQDGEKIVRQFLIAALLTARVCERLFSSEKPEIIVLHHGIYVPQGVIAEVARKHGIRIVTWLPSYRKGTFIFSHDDTYHRTMITEPTESWRTMAWDAQKEKTLLDYLASRQRGSADWIWFHERPSFDEQHLRTTLRLDASKPVIGLLTNVVWDAQLHYPNNAYPTMLDWLFDTIDHFKTRDDVQLLIRIHPAEIYGAVPSRQTVMDAIAARYASLPEHIKIIPPLSEISTYSAMALCDSVLIYSTKTGIELSAVGIPVIVAGDAWIRGKGFARDANHPEEYKQLLAQLPLRQRMRDEQIALAKRYAYHFFFRRMIPLSIFTPARGPVPFTLKSDRLEALVPGACAGLDTVCDGILKATPFIYEERSGN